MIQEELDKFEKEFRFHLSLAEESETYGGDFGRGRGAGIRDLVRDLRQLLYFMEKL